MAFLNNNSFLFNGTLTANGRKAIASGKFNLKYYALGDSEINYANPLGANILAPKEFEDMFQYYLSGNNCDPFIELGTSLKTLECCYANPQKKKSFFKTEHGFDPKKILSTGTLPLSALNGSTELNIGTDISLVNDGDILALVINPNTNNTNRHIIFYKFRIKHPYSIIAFDRALPLIIDPNINVDYFLLNGNINDYYHTNFSTNWDYNCGKFFKDCFIDECDVFSYNQTICGDYIGIKQCDVENSSNEPNFTGFYTKIGYEKFCNPCSSGTTNCIDDIIYDKEANYKNKIGIIHYTNPSSDDLGGPFFYVDNDISLKIELPHITWYDNPITSSGLTLISSGNTVADSCGHIYVPIWANNLQVGRLFTTLKVIVIDDQELLNVMSFASNRSYTLPPINSKLIGSGGSIPFLNPNETAHITYVFEGADIDLYTFPQGNIKVLENLTTKPKNIELGFDVPDVFKFMGGTLSTFTYNAVKIYALIQITPYGELPTVDKWKKIDLTTIDLTAGIVNGTIVPDLLYDQVWRPSKITYDAAPYYYLDIYNNNITECLCLNLWQDSPFMGNVLFSTGNCNYKSIFELEIDSTTLTASKNPTFTTDSLPSISEIGIFDDNKELMINYKVKHPISITDGDKILIQLSMDF